MPAARATDINQASDPPEAIEPLLELMKIKFGNGSLVFKGTTGFLNQMQKLRISDQLL